MFQYTAATTLVVTVVSIIMSLAIEKGPNGRIGMFCHTEYCIFGWTNPEWVWPMLLFGLFIGDDLTCVPEKCDKVVVGVICIAGYNYSVQHISPLVFSSLTLLEPAVTGGRSCWSLTLSLILVLLLSFHFRLSVLDCSS
jgi:hypothetical protein